MSEAISTELRQVLRHLKLSPMLATLPERLVLARQQKLPHQDFLELVLADEVARREQVSAQHRARSGLLDPSMTLEAWDTGTDVRFDHQLWNELCTLRFMEEAASVLILGPVGVGKTMLANCLGHIACRRRHSVLMLRTERMLKRLKGARLDASYDQELRRLIRVDLLILDDFALQAFDHQETQDIYELIVERHRRASLVVVSNREPVEWLATMADPLLAQSAVDRLLNSAFELVLDGDSYRRRQKPGRHANLS
jgi:DNA replication protein DnaC